MRHSRPHRLLAVFSALLAAAFGPAMQHALAQSTVPNLQYPGLVYAWAGNGRSGYTVVGTTVSWLVRIGSIQDGVFDSRGNLFIADSTTFSVERVDASTRIIANYAGTPQTSGNTCTDGAAATTCSIGAIVGIAVDKSGNVYIADQTYNVIRRIDANGYIHPFAGSPTTTGAYGGDNGPASAAQFSSLNGIMLDASGTYLYIADTNNNRIRRINMSTNVITTFAGTGTAGTPAAANGDGAAATSAQLNAPYGVAQALDGDIYIADTKDYVIRMVSAATGNISTVAGNGVQLTSTNNNPGNGGLALAAQLDFPKRVAVDTAGNLYISDSNYNQIRAVNAVNGTISATGSYMRAWVGTGSFTNPSTFVSAVPATTLANKAPVGVFFDNFGQMYYAEQGFNTIMKVSTQTQIPLNQPYSYSFEAVGTPITQAIGVVANANTTLAAATPNLITPSSEFTLSTTTCSAASSVSIGTSCSDTVQFLPLGVGVRAAQLTTVDNAGTRYNASLIGLGSAPLPLIYPSNITTFAGTGVAGYSGDNGTAATATLRSAQGVTSDGAGNIFVADTANNVIRRIDASTGKITTYAGTGVAGYSGDGSAATSARFSGPAAVTADAGGNLFVADTGNNVIRRVDASTGLISTYAGTGSASFGGDNGGAALAQLNAPSGVAVDLLGYVYIADTGNNRIRAVAPNPVSPALPGLITTVAGTGAAGYTGDGGLATAATLKAPTALAMGPVIGPTGQTSVLYIADTGNHAVRSVYLPWTQPTSANTGLIVTVAGNGTPGHSGDGGLATGATLSSPSGIAVDPGGNLFIAESGNQDIRLMTAGTKVIQTIAATGSGTTGYTGDGGLSSAATLYSPHGLTFDPAMHLYVADTSNNVIRLIDPTSTTVQFGSIPKNTTSTVALQLINAGNQSLTVSGLTTGSPFAQTATTGSDCTASTTLNAGGACNLSIQFAPGSAVNTFSATTTLTDNSLNATTATQQIQLRGTSTNGLVSQTITFASIPTQTYGASPMTLAATASSGLAVTYSVTGPATLNGSTLTITGAGQVSVTASQPGNASYAAATPVTQAFTVNQALLTVTAANASCSVGAANPTFTYTVTGYVNNDTPSAAYSGLPSLTTTATTSSPAGNYPISVSAGTLTSANYSFAFVAGVLTVAQLTAQTITFGPLSSVVYGAGLVSLTATASSGLPITYAVTGPATVNGATLTITGAGNVTVTAQQNGNGTYAAATPVSQSFTVAQAALAITINNATKVYGAALPAFTTKSVTGLVNGDSIGGTLSLSYSTAATAGSPVATNGYSVSAALSGSAAANYSVTITPGTLTVTPASLNVTPASVSIVYGTAVPTFTYTLSGFVNGDTSAVVSGTPVLASSAGSSTPPAGAYTITATQGTLAAQNYSFSFLVGTLTVTKAASTSALSASATSVAYAQSITFTATVTSTAGTPTGTVTFYNGTSSIGTGSLNTAGVATLTTSSLPSGALSIKATYGGDSNFGASSSAVTTVTVAAPIPDFTVGINPSSIVFSAGQQGTATVTLTPLFNYKGSVSFACSGSATVSCAFSPSSTLTLDGSGSVVTGTITVTSTASAANHRLFRNDVTALALLFPTALPFLMKRRRRFALRMMAVLPLTLLLGAALVGCGTGGGQAAGKGSSVVTLTGAGSTGGQTHTYLLEVTVQ